MLEVMCYGWTGSAEDNIAVEVKRVFANSDKSCRKCTEDYLKCECESIESRRSDAAKISGASTFTLGLKATSVITAALALCPDTQ